MTEPSLELVTSEGHSQQEASQQWPRQLLLWVPLTLLLSKFCPQIRPQSLAGPCSSPVSLIFTSAKDGRSCLSLYKIFPESLHQFSFPTRLEGSFLSLHQTQHVSEFPSTSCVHAYACTGLSFLYTYIFHHSYMVRGGGPGVQCFQAMSQLRVLEEMLRNPFCP